MRDDIGWFNLGAYNGGMMLNATPIWIRSRLKECV
jgi:hypothetical protein